MALPFEFTLEGPPVSQQARRRERIRQWTQDVRNAAGYYWDGSPPAVGAIMVSIVYIFDSVQLDVDNIPKPILDGLKGLVYSDDGQITDLICRKRDKNDDFQISGQSPVFIEFLSQRTQFLYIRISDAPISEVSL